VRCKREQRVVETARWRVARFPRYSSCPLLLCSETRRESRSDVAKSERARLKLSIVRMIKKTDPAQLPNSRWSVRTRKPKAER
jgi:hypothetical protein